MKQIKWPCVPWTLYISLKFTPAKAWVKSPILVTKISLFRVNFDVLKLDLTIRVANRVMIWNIRDHQSLSRIRAVFQTICEYIIYQGCWCNGNPCGACHQWEKLFTCYEIIKFSSKFMRVMVKEIYAKIHKRVAHLVLLSHFLKIYIQLDIEGPEICCWRSINNSNQNIFVDL